MSHSRRRRTAGAVICLTWSLLPGASHAQDTGATANPIVALSIVGDTEKNKSLGFL